MKSLEEVLGRKLFRKEGRNLVMTEEGELLERRAADIIGLTDKTLSEFRAPLTAWEETSASAALNQS